MALMIWCLQKSQAYLSVCRGFLQAPERKELVQIAGEDRSS